MTTRRDAIGILGAMAGTAFVSRALDATTAHRDPTPPLAPGAPNSPERLALIERFTKQSAGIESQFEAHTFAADWAMPYRIFRPKAASRLPLVIYLHGSGGLGTDNQKQMGLGNTFGTRVWALPENQNRFPCYVIAPQTDRGWVRYGEPEAGDSIARVIPGLGDGAKAVLALVDSLRRELPIDDRRIYVTGQSMGGAGAWHLLVQRPNFFAAAAICCGGESLDNVAPAAASPIWNFHGDADRTVPVSRSRERIAALRKAGGHPIATEYAGVDHDVWEWAYTEPALPTWLFAQQARAG